MPEQERSDQSEEKCSGDTACCCGKTACEYTKQTIIFDGLSYTLGKEMAEARQGYCSPCACEVRKGLIKSEGGKDHACDDEAREYTCRCEFCEVYKELSYGAHSTAHKESFKDIKKHIIVPFLYELNVR